MTEKDDALFETLEPPRGGLVGLRARIERDARRRRLQRRLGSTAVATVLLVVIGWSALGPRREVVAASPELDLVRMQLGLLAAPAEPLTLPAGQHRDTAVRRVPLPTDEVIFYMVGSIHEWAAFRREFLGHVDAGPTGRRHLAATVLDGRVEALATTGRR